MRTSPKKSLSKKSLLFRVYGLFSVLILAMVICVLSLSFKVKDDIFQAELDNLFVAVETGPLEFARIYSADIAKMQLDKLLEGIASRNKSVKSVEIFGGPEGNQKFSSWNAGNFPGAKCMGSLSRTYETERSLYPFRVEIGYSKCENLRFIDELQHYILVTLAISFLIMIVGPTLIFFPVVKSLQMMEKVISRRESDHGSEQSILYEPLRRITALALLTKDAEKKIAVANIVSQIAHDMRAPMGIFERLIHIDPSSLNDMKGDIKASLNRIHSMIESFRRTDLEGLIKVERTKFDFNSSLNLLSSKISLFGVRVAVQSPEMADIFIDPTKFERALINLVLNAMEAAKSEVEVEFERVGEGLCVKIIDDGCGVPREILDNLFSQGATFGKRDGTGLGLAYVKQVMKGHGGDVKYYRQNDLTVFECFLPKAFSFDCEPGNKDSSDNSYDEDTFVKAISVCLVPESLNQEFSAALRKQIKIEWKLATEYSEKSNIIISNSNLTIDRALEDGKILIEFKNGASVDVMLRKTKLRLGLA